MNAATVMVMTMPPGPYKRMLPKLRSAIRFYANCYSIWVTSLYVAVSGAVVTSGWGFRWPCRY